MAFILFLIVGGYLCFILASDHGGQVSTEKKMKQEEEEFNKEYKEFVDKYGASEDITDTICDMVANKDDRLDELSTELEEVTGDVPWKEMVILGALAKMGKLTQKVAQGGIMFCPYKGGSEFFPQQWWKFLLWYDKTLRENGMEFDMVILRQSDDTYHYLPVWEKSKALENCKPIKDITYEYVHPWSRFFWMPNRKKIYTDQLGQDIYYVGVHKKELRDITC